MNYAIILAGGTGARAGGNLPKQFHILAGKPVLWWSLNAFRRFDPEITLVLVMHPDYCEFWSELNDSTGDPIRSILCNGGSSRLESVSNGLSAIRDIVFRYCQSTETRLPEHADSCKDVVMIHDGARPLVSGEVIGDAFSKVKEGVGVVPVTPLTDSIREIITSKRNDDESAYSVMADRSRFKAVQTPQVFMLQDLMRAYDAVDFDDKTLTDDGSVAERYGIRVVLSAGDPINIKITNPNDFRIAEALMSCITPKINNEN